MRVTWRSEYCGPRDLGEDPSGAQMALPNAISIEQLCEEYVSDMENGEVAGNKASTAKSDISRIATHIKPVLGKQKITIYAVVEQARNAGRCRAAVLRHSFASLAADMGLADHVIAGLTAGDKDGSNELKIALLLIDSK